MTTRKISEITTQADSLTATDRLEVSQGIGTTPVTRYLTPSQITDYVEGDLSTLPNGLVTNAMVSASAGIVDTKLGTISSSGKVSNSATTATNNNTASAIVARDASGDFSARDVSLRQLVLRGDTSGTATVKVPAAAGTPTFTLPSSGGTNGQFLQTNGSGVMSWATVAPAPTVKTAVLVYGLGSNYSATGSWSRPAFALDAKIDPDSIANDSSEFWQLLTSGSWAMSCWFQGTSTFVGDVRIRNPNNSETIAQGYVGAETQFGLTGIRSSYTNTESLVLEIQGSGTLTAGSGVFTVTIFKLS